MTSLLTPSKDQALQFAIMLSSGLPGPDAIRYFLPEGEDLTPGVIKSYLDKWTSSPTVQAAIVELQGGPWQSMTLDERCRFVVDKTYTEMAYYLYSHNYAELVGADRQKADTCRTVLETKLAGMAGKLGAVEQFWADLASGKVKLAGAGAQIVTKGSVN